MPFQGYAIEESFIVNNVGCSIGLIYAGMVLAIQLLLFFNLYQNRAWKVFSLFCADEPSIFTNFRVCFLSWWSMCLSLCFTFSLMVYSFIKYKALDRKWWLIILPVFATLSIVFSVMVTPIIFIEHPQ
jgi:hypothetical protein